MLRKKPKLLRQITRAAELRARGASWRSIAAEAGVTEHRAQSWPQEYRDLWQQALSEAEKNIEAELAAEASQVLRTMLRSDDQKLRRDAARLLLELRIKSKRAESRVAAEEPPLSTGAERVARYLEGIDDAELPNLVQELLDLYRPEAGGQPHPVRAPQPGDA